MRCLLMVLDSVGVGHAPDAGQFGDEGANTLGHILEQRPDLRLPALWSLGMGQIVNCRPAPRPSASFGRMREVSPGKDSTTGHWEIAGAPLDQPLGFFEKFPPELVHAIEQQAGVKFLGKFPASGTAIIDELGPEHLKTGRPILYTSADSVLQIAAHEEVIPVERLYAICRIAREEANRYRIGRVIARPFIGQPGAFTRTGHRHDFSLMPPRTVLNALAEAGFPVVSIGKVVDLFAGEGITESHPTASNEEGMQTMERVWPGMDRGLLFVNLVDFDSLWGHRRDAEGYARGLEQFDRWLGGFLPSVNSEDLFIITADHGNDPTCKGTDHTREETPLLVRWRNVVEDLGCRESFADIAATLAGYFGISGGWPVGQSFLTAFGRKGV